MDSLLHAIGVTPQLLVTQVIGFLIFAALFWRMVQKPLLGVLDQRQADIKATYDQLDADRDAMAAVRREYEQRLSQIEAEGREKIQAAVKEAQSLRESIVADARREAESLLERGRVESERERQKAFLEMRGEIVTLALGAAGKVVGEALDAQRHAKLVDDFIAGVSASGGSASPQREASA